MDYLTTKLLKNAINPYAELKFYKNMSVLRAQLDWAGHGRYQRMLKKPANLWIKR